MQSTVTALVCAYNDEATIGIVLQALLQLKYDPPIEIVVVDDASTDRTAEIVAQYPVKLLRNTENRGLGHNQNLGLSAATGEYLALVQSDCEVLGTDWLNRMVEPFRDEQTAVVVSQREIQNFASLPLGARLFNAVAPQDLINKTGRVVRLQYCRGKADVYRVSTLKELRGWDSSFFTAGEDTDLSLRLRAKNLRILLHPQAKIRYLFSSRQSSVLGALKKGFLYGETAVPLFSRYHYDGIQARTYLLLIATFVGLQLPFPLIFGLLLFIYSFTCSIQTRKSWSIPFGVLACAGALPFLYEAQGNIKSILPTLPAKSILAGGSIYLLYLAAMNTFRNWRSGERLIWLPVTFVFCVCWRLISGVGYLVGLLKRITGRS